MGLIRSELYCFVIRTQKIIFYCLRSTTNYIRLNYLDIKKVTGAKLSRFVIYIEAITICCDSFINFIVVAVFINCSNS